MDKFGPEIVCRETIRPSSPTPPHLRIYNLSLLDQLGPLLYTPITLFYSVNDANFDPNKAVEQLKDSLSQTLSFFYPLAGRLRDHLSVDCNDIGALFSVATVRLHLLEYLKNPNLDFLDHFLPSLEIVSPDNMNSAVQVAVQVTVFSSGGLAIGLRFLHRIADANTMAAFLRVWSGIASGETTNSFCSEIKPFHFKEASFHFPPLQEALGEDMMLLDTNWLRKKENSVRSRVVFSAGAISVLKDRAGEEDHLPNPTRFEVVTSLIWKHALAASISLSGGGCDAQPSMLMVAVNLRPKTEPPMDKKAIGSTVWLALAHQTANAETGIGGIGGGIRRAVKKLATDLVGHKEPSVAIQRQVKETKDKYYDKTPIVYTSSSWCSFPFYEADFGWGKPVWVAFTSQVFTTSPPSYINSMNLIDDKSGDGVEAWLLLGENHTAKLLSDSDFLRFASVNPSIPNNFLEERS